jgi:CSLREA domain-containing protein
MTLEAPAQVQVGDVIAVRLRVDGNVQVGGLEALVAYPRTAAEFASFSPAQPSGDAGQGRLVVPELAAGSAVGYYTCATPSCLRGQERQIQAAAEPGILAEVELLGLTAGQLEVRVAHLQLVDRNGLAIPVIVTPATVTVQVGEGGELHSAPADQWTPSTSAMAVAASVTAADITRDGAVSNSDIMEVALAWEVAHENGNPCAGGESGADINQDGCVDILDVQAAAAYAGGQNAPAANNPAQMPEQLHLPQVDNSNDAASAAAISPEDTVEDTVQVAATSTYTVNSTLDEFDTNANDGICKTASGVCTLRAAIEQANAAEGSNTIIFAIPGNDVHTIQLTSRLPALHDETGGTLINGYSQSGAAPNTDPTISNAQIRVEIRGDGYTAFDALPITSAGNVVKGLSFYNLKRSIWIYGSGAYSNVIIGNFIGTNAAGTFSSPSVADNEAHGVHIEQGALGNRVGGLSPAERNIISGNARHGIGLWHPGTDENVIVNNIVGLSPDGLHRIPNRQQGVDINYGASYNIVGGTKPQARNIISGNGENGAEVSHTQETTKNEIRGNYIGTDLSGENAAAYTANGGVGISLHDRIMDNLVADNVIGNNRGGGLLIDDFGVCCTTDNKVQGNWIGVSPAGNNIANGVFGIELLAPKSHIGPNNIIAYNPVGIQIEGDDHDGNIITHNSIFNNTGLGIDIAPLGQINANDSDDADAGPNEMLNFPILAVASTTEVSGTACSGCTIELFIADRKTLDYGQGKTFIGESIADEHGTFTITLENVVVGDYLTATATDINGNTSEFSKNVLVVDSSNTPPAAVDDTAITYGGVPVTVDVLSNDSDPEGDALSVVAVDNAGHGAVTTNGAFVVYTPTVEFEGLDSFTYTASDGIGGTSTATVTVTVQKSTVITTGIVITPSELTLSMGGAPVSYTVSLVSQPAAPVIITLVADDPLVVAPGSLRLTSENWDIPQVVVVSVPAGSLAISSVPDSAVTRVIQQSAVRHSIKSEDAAYNNVGAPTLIVNITEPETGGLFLPSILR